MLFILRTDYFVLLIIEPKKEVLASKEHAKCSLWGYKHGLLYVHLDGVVVADDNFSREVENLRSFDSRSLKLYVVSMEHAHLWKVYT